MELKQVIVSATEQYLTDRFLYNVGSSFDLQLVQDSTDAPSGFANSLKLDVTTADSTVLRFTLVYLEQLIEGQNLQRFCIWNIKC